MENPCLDQPIGSWLRQKREEKELSIEFVADYLRLHKDRIEDLEEGNYNKIPSPYLIGYLRAYAKLLAIPVGNHLNAKFDAIETNGISSMENWKLFANPKQISASNKFMQWITYSIISSLIILVTLWWKSDDLISYSLKTSPWVAIFDSL